ncbi:hypothetical protein ACJMK2_021443 [Sinanodonta woodiana]|uniref:Uncharacterized protein n=1 Tax=Sinanodonta woodiana TaxID=1069815 RepID=A0ABD3TG35_SINWO
MGNNQGHSNEVETVKEEKETPSCCELKRRKSKSKGASPEEREEEETREDVSQRNVLKNSFDNVSLNTDSKDSPTQHITEMDVARYASSDDRANNSLPQQDITKLKLDTDVSDYPESLFECGESQARNMNDVTNDKEGPIASKHEISKRSVTSDAFNSSALLESKMKLVEASVPVQSVLQLLENTEQESATVSYTPGHICHTGIILPETANISTPIIINTHHMPCHINAPEISDSSLPFKSEIDCLDGGGTQQVILQHEMSGACTVECATPESMAKHSNLNSANDCQDFVRKPSATMQLENQDACSVELTALEPTASLSEAKNQLSSDEKHETVISGCESGNMEETKIWNVTPNETCKNYTFANMTKAQKSKGEEEFKMVGTASSMCPVQEYISVVQQKRLESQDVILNNSIKEPDKHISQDTIDDRTCEIHKIQGKILSIDSATRKSVSDAIISTVNTSDSIQQSSKENVIQKRDDNDTLIEGNVCSEKQDSDSLKEFEETELLCLSEVEESNAVVRNEHKADFGEPAISGLDDKEMTVRHNVLQGRDEPQAEESSMTSSLNDNAKLQSGSKLQNSCQVKENLTKHKACQEGECLDLDQGCKSWKDSSCEMQYRIDSKSNNQEQLFREEDDTYSQEVDQLKIRRGEESEDGTVPPPTPSFMAIWQEEDEEKLEEEEGDVSNKETCKEHINQMGSEFGDIVCRRLSLLLESQTLLSFTDDDDIPVGENLFLASEMDENEYKYKEDIIKQSKDLNELKDENKSSLNVGKEKLSGLTDFDNIIHNSKQTDEEVIKLSNIFPKLEEKITVEIEEVNVRHDTCMFVTEELASEKSGGDIHPGHAVSADKAHSDEDKDTCRLNEHIKQDLEVKEIDKMSESSNIRETSFSETENNHNYVLGSDEEDVVEVMDALDDVIDEAYSQVFATEKAARFLETEVEMGTNQLTNQMEDEHDIKSLKMNEIDPTKNETKQHLEDKPTKKTLNPTALMSDSAQSSKEHQEGSDDTDSIADDSCILYNERDNTFSQNTLTLVDSINIQHDVRHEESSLNDTSTIPIEQEPTLSLKIQQMEEAYSRAQTVDELGDRTPTSESFPELTALTELASAAVDNLVQYHPSGRRSVSRTESDLDISEQRDDLSTEGMYADDEDDETMEILFTRTYTEPKRGTEAFISCTVVNSAFRQANKDSPFLKYAVPETLDLLEGSIEVMPPSFIKAKKEMRDIQVHLQSLRKQMEHFHDDIDESSLPDLGYLSPDPQPRRAITD